MELDLEELAAVVEILSGLDFTEFRLQKGDLSLVVNRGGASAQDDVALPTPSMAANTSFESRTVSSNSSPIAPITPESNADGGSPPALGDADVLIKAPMLGTFYRSPKPGEPNFIEIGDKVDTNSVICIIEVMKLMNSINAGIAGEVTQIFAHDGQLVEAGQPLFAIRTTE